MSRRAGVSIQQTVYSTFKGADFSTDPSLVEKNRSPMCTNIMADEGGMPEKRPGWRSVHDFGEELFGVHAAVFEGTEHLLVHAGTKLYRWNGESTVQLLTGLAAHRSRSAFLSGRLWIVTGGELVSYDGTTAQKVSAGDCYVPTITITRMPTGGGVPYEDVNLLTPRRKEAFQTDGSSRTFTLSGSIDSGTTVRAWVWDAETTDFTVNGSEGTVTFTTAPEAPDAGSADGVVIEYAHTVEGYADRINKCTIITTYGLEGTDRLVLAGNQDMPNVDWISGFEDPTYFPDLGYSTIGSDATAIKGYCRVGQYLAIVKEDNGRESSVYLRHGYLNDEGEAVFIVNPAISGVGAAATGSFASLLDDPLFLSPTGIHAISVSDVQGTRVTQNRSFFLNPKLVKEENLAESEAVVWKGLYLLSTPAGHVYVLDARQEKSYRSAAMGDFVYEGYYWENIPAACWLCREETLWFGTREGKLCRMSDDMETMGRFSDDGEAISAVWATKYDDDGTPAYLKTLLKKGCCVTIKPYSRSSAEILFRTDRTEGTEKRVSYDTMDIFDWADIDFERFTFSTDDSPKEIFFRRKEKNYKRLQIIIRNDANEEGFGVFQITKLYVVGNFARR